MFEILRISTEGTAAPDDDDEKYQLRLFVGEQDHTSNALATRIISQTRLSEKEEVQVGFTECDPLHIETTKDRNFLVSTVQRIYIIPSNERKAREFNPFRPTTSMYYLKMFNNLLFIFYPSGVGSVIDPTTGKEVHSIPYGLRPSLPVNSLANTSRNVKAYGEKLYFIDNANEIVELTIREGKLEATKTNEKDVADFEIDERGTLIIADENNKLKYGEHSQDFKEHLKEFRGLVTIAFRINIGKYSKQGILVSGARNNYKQVLFSLNRQLSILDTLEFSGSDSRTSQIITHIVPLPHKKVEFYLLNLYESEIALVGMVGAKPLHIQNMRIGSYIWSFGIRNDEIFMTYGGQEMCSVKLIIKND